VIVIVLPHHQHNAVATTVAVGVTCERVLKPARLPWCCTG
jgi:hypothetical protein